MANKEIKHTIRLEGEKEYSAAIKEAQRNLKTLRSELKAETAELGSNATAQQKNEARAKSLKAQIAEQEKVVETLRKALAEAKKDYGDNEDVVQKWEQRLNEARTTLANMQNGLTETENGIRGVSDATAEGVTATRSFADALGSIATVGESVSSAIEDIFTGLISTVSDTIVELWDLIGETAAKANRWTDIAGYWNTDAANIEKWENAVRATSNNFEDLEAIVSKLVLGGKTKQIAEMLHVSDEGYTDQWEYAMAVMDSIYDMQKSGTLPENMWETIFGEKKATKAMDLINDWDRIRGKLGTYNADEGGFGLASDEIEAMAELRMQIDDVETRMDALKAKFAGQFSEISIDLLVNVSGGLEALNDYMNADSDAERDAALAKLEQNITEFFNKIAAAIEAGLKTVNKVGQSLAKSENPIVSAIGKALEAITNAGQWIIDNADEVQIHLERIFGLWLLAKLAIIGGKITSIIADIKTIKAFSNYSGGLGSALSGGSKAAGVAGAAEEGLSAGAYVNNFAGFIALAGVAALFQRGVHYRNKYGALGSEEALETAVGQDNELRQAFIDFVEAQQRLEDMEMNFDRYSGEEQDTIAAEAKAASERFNAMEGSGVLWDLYNDWRMTNGQTMMDWGMPETFFRDAGNVIADSLEQTLGGTGKGVQSVLNGDAVGELKGIPGMMKQAVITGLSGMKIFMDGETVGRIVTPYVSGGIALKVVELQ